MSKKSKAKRSDYRKKQKRARKDAQQALYESYKKAGTNKKSKRNSLSSKRNYTIKTVKHAATCCGNVGCERESCFPYYRRLRMNEPPAR